MLAFFFLWEHARRHLVVSTLTSRRCAHTCRLCFQVATERAGCVSPRPLPLSLGFSVLCADTTPGVRVPVSFSFKSGTLYKYRPWAEGVFADPWARRFISLIGNTLMSYRSEHDVAHLPRSTVTLDEHCTVLVSCQFA